MTKKQNKILLHIILRCKTSEYIKCWRKGTAISDCYSFCVFIETIDDMWNKKYNFATHRTTKLVSDKELKMWHA